MTQSTTQIKSTEAQKASWVRAAQADGRTLSSWIRVVLDAAAQTSTDSHPTGTITGPE